jgi:CBS domain-containing protein
MKLEDLKSTRIDDLKKLLVQTDVPTAEVNATLEAALPKIKNEASGSYAGVVVDDAQKKHVVGVLTGSDAANALVTQGKTLNLRKTTIGQIANPNVISVKLTDTVDDAVSKFRTKPIDFIVVTSDEGKFEGVIRRRNLALEVQRLLE